MKVTITREALLPALERAAKIIHATTNIPILRCVRLEADDHGFVKVAATDMDMTFTEEIDLGADPARPGVVCVQAKPFAAAVKAAPKGALIEIEALPPEPVEPGAHVPNYAPTAIVRSGRQSGTIMGRDPADWPTPALPAFKTLTLPPSELTRLFGAVAHAISTEVTRYYLCGIYLHNRAGEMCAVATDGHRMARATSATFDGRDMPAEWGAIAPHAAVTFIQKWLSKAKGHLTVGLGTVDAGCQRLYFEFAGGRLDTKAVDGPFLDYERIIPNAQEHRLEFATAPALDFLASLNGHNGTVKLDCSRGSIRLTADLGEEGKRSTEIEADVRGKPLTVGFSARYLRDELRLVGAGPYACVTITTNAAGDPAILTSRERPGETHVLMPMRV